MSAFIPNEILSLILKQAANPVASRVSKQWHKGTDQEYQSQVSQTETLVDGLMQRYVRKNDPQATVTELFKVDPNLVFDFGHKNNHVCDDPACVKPCKKHGWIFAYWLAGPREVRYFTFVLMPEVVRLLRRQVVENHFSGLNLPPVKVPTSRACVRSDMDQAYELLIHAGMLHSDSQDERTQISVLPAGILGKILRMVDNPPVTRVCKKWNDVGKPISAAKKELLLLNMEADLTFEQSGIRQVAKYLFVDLGSQDIETDTIKAFHFDHFEYKIMSARVPRGDVIMLMCNRSCTGKYSHYEIDPKSVDKKFSWRSLQFGADFLLGM